LLPPTDVVRSPDFLAIDPKGVIPVLVTHSKTSLIVKHTVAMDDDKTRTPAKTLTSVR
jgi:glutathione S-transferase